MIPVGVFNGYYPYGLKDSISKIKAAGFSCVQLDLSFKDIDMTRGEHHGAEVPHRPRRLPRREPADLLHLRLHEHRAPRPRGTEEECGLPEGDHPPRAGPRRPLRDLGDRHVQLLQRLGP